MKPPLGTPRLVLRPFVASDAAKLLRMSREEALRTWIPSQVYRDEAHAAAVLDYLISQYDAPGDPRLGPYVLGVESRHSGELIGHVGLSRFGDDVEVGFAIEQAHQGKGLATEAVRAMCDWACREFALASILGIAALGNRASQAVLRKAGFERKGERMIRMHGVEQPVVIYCTNLNAVPALTSTTALR
ncbi:MAG: GNAT family N-acetyltransferase [Betaproteobacteria bacterium]